MELWTEVRTVLFVGRLGTVRAAAEAMGVHRATVSRHIDLLEEHLGAKLFLRHRDGYALTDAGAGLMDVAERVNDALSAFERDLSVAPIDLTGTLKVSAVAKASPVIKAAMKLFCDAHPNARVKFHATTDLPKLETGEAHIAVKAGVKPQHPDYVPISYFSFPIGLYAHRDYLCEHGAPQNVEDLKNHRFVGAASARSDFDLPRHFGDYPLQENVVLESEDPSVIFDAVLEGIGVGLAAKEEASTCPELVEILPTASPLSADVWIITHIDVHRSPLVQSFIECLKAVSPPPLR
jgi:DNA-binding transcriptional LysR family regulator